jgi:SAM-dependent methyltransferase
MRAGVIQPLLRRVRAGLYDAAIVPMTAGWYAAVLERLPERCRLLDVGIGTGAALLANAALVEARDIRVTGIDIDTDYIERCREAVAARGLADRIDVRLESVYDHAGGPYDAAYFSGSFMLLPDPGTALEHVASLLAPEARVFFTQTFEHERSWWMERVKPLLRFVTSIDFGAVTYERDFLHALSAAGMSVESRETIHEGPSRSSVLVVAESVRV